VRALYEKERRTSLGRRCTEAEGNGMEEPDDAPEPEGIHTRPHEPTDAERARARRRDIGERGALYRVRYTLNYGRGDYLYEAVMIYLGPGRSGEEEFSLRPLAGTQSLRRDSIKVMELLESAEAVSRKYHGARGNPPVKHKKRLRKWVGA
jgi:hypothetical protein